MHWASRRHLSTGRVSAVGRSSAARYGAGSRISQRIPERVGFLLLFQRDWVLGGCAVRAQQEMVAEAVSPPAPARFEEVTHRKTASGEAKRGSVTRQPQRPLRNLFGIGKERLFERRAIGHRRIARRYAHNGAVQRLESLLRDARGQFPADAAG